MSSSTQSTVSPIMASEQLVKKMLGADVTFGPGLEVKDIVIPPTTLSESIPYLTSFHEHRYSSVMLANIVRLHWRNPTATAMLTYRDASKCREVARRFNDGEAGVCGKYVQATFLTGQRGPQVQLTRLPLKATKSDITHGLPASLYPSRTFIGGSNAKLASAAQLQAIKDLISTYGTFVVEDLVRDHGDESSVKLVCDDESDARRVVKELNNTVQKSAGINQLFAEICFNLEYRFSAKWLNHLKKTFILQTTDAMSDNIDGEIASIRYTSANKESILFKRDSMDLVLRGYMDSYGDGCESNDFAEGRMRDCTKRECSICFCPPEQTVRTSCGHIYCAGCYEHTVLSNAKSPSQNGIKCFGDSGKCGMPITLQELDSNLGYKGVDKLIERSLSSYLQANTATYHCCPTPGCEQLYKVTPMAADNKGTIQRCVGCLEILCTSCHMPHDDNVTCDKAEDHVNAELMKGLNIKPCPKCKTPVDRYEGCNHLECKCGAHVCWHCMAVFDNSGECYKHMTDAHNSIYAGQPLYDA
ncbi:hypothetical protein CFIO01_05324 [Colletotrichum fioriniae PJ7]|uniref:RBR-type E3 ubiquitin transferase n=1 Tax=Colletotrichum fioriniae PJ7 TaxID=1445577 RepID=A0A010RTX3_9PEZI|nr:hypothetical protein CFIO01_05324 [Colletotrichum fioriniae PJ7]